MLWRGLTKRCPVCGGGHLYDGWFRMKERCPRCGYRFEREEGFFLGASIVNLAVAEALMAVLCIVPAIYLAAAGRTLWPVVVGGLFAALIAPFLFYPFSRTIWVALELLLRPADAPEPTDNR
jgi:uncharacterized protein (DUF983 family)